MIIGHIYRVIPGFKIKSKADVKRFIEECLYKDGEWVLKERKDKAMIITKSKGKTRVSFKFGDLSDIFNPEFDQSDVIGTLYKKRKLVNEYFFNRD